MKFSTEGGINRRELTFKSLAGLCGGALGWLPIEITSFGHSLTEAESPARLLVTFLAMVLFSGIIGAFIVASELQVLEVTPAVKRRFFRGLLICTAMGLPAAYIANHVFSAVAALGGWGVGQQGSVLALIVARTVGWSLMGMLVGIGVGIATFSVNNLLKGAAGGWVGGFVSGLAFDLLGAALGLGGLPSRLFGFSLTGLAIGLFIGLVQELTKSAWVTVEAGRLKGREYRFEKPVAFVGRAEENEVGLFGDSAVAARHARIDRNGQDYFIRDLSIREGTTVNGARVESAKLNDGDRIAIGGYQLSFHLRKASGSPFALGQSFSRPRAVPEPFAAQASAQSTANPTNGNAPYLVDAEGRHLTLRPGSVTRLGRLLDNDVVLTDNSISRHHAEIAPSGAGFALRDLNSQNGTYLDGTRVAEAPLRSGDKIKLGDAHFVFRS